MTTIPRLYTQSPLSDQAEIILTPAQSHYLVTVLRRSAGATLRVFNGRDGEWTAQVTTAHRKATTVYLVERIRPQRPEPGCHVLFAPIKKARLDFLVEKATELGVARLTPVSTQHTVVDRVNTDRLRATVTEAAEQCERLSVPAVDAPEPLPALLERWSTDQPLFVALARQDAGDWPGIAAGITGPALLIGPEGGFSDDEQAALAAHPAVRPVTLGARILRAETAVLAALARWDGHRGTGGARNF